MLVAIASLAEAVILVSLGVWVFGLELPTDAFRWFTMAWVFVLGIISCSLLGIFISNFASNAVSAAVITNGPAVGLQFLSGTYVPLMVLPTWMLIIGSIFPGEVDGPGFPVGAIARTDGGFRAGRQLGSTGGHSSSWRRGVSAA